MLEFLGGNFTGFIIGLVIGLLAGWIIGKRLEIRKRTI